MYFNSLSPEVAEKEQIISQQILHIKKLGREKMELKSTADELRRRIAEMNNTQYANESIF